jgi:D-glycero-D-manno-heptose 1,7-bisphosphate phosphatase
MKKAIFLDRDGVINRERGDYTFKIEDFIINDGLTEALSFWKDKGYIFIVITNQGGIAKGLYSHHQVHVLHQYLIESLSSKWIDIVDVYYCPHHPDYGKCLCRKPGSLMLEKAIARYDIDIKQSYFIGDADRDMVAGNALGLHCIKIEPNASLLTIKSLIG